MQYDIYILYILNIYTHTDISQFDELKKCSYFLSCHLTVKVQTFQYSATQGPLIEIISYDLPQRWSCSVVMNSDNFCRSQKKFSEL